MLLMQPFVLALSKSKFALRQGNVAQGAVGVRLFWVKRTGGYVPQGSRAQPAVRLVVRSRMEPTSGVEPLTWRLRIIGESYRCSSSVYCSKRL